jgi:hypothetical protein
MKIKIVANADSAASEAAKLIAREARAASNTTAPL